MMSQSIKIPFVKSVSDYKITRFSNSKELISLFRILIFCTLMVLIFHSTNAQVYSNKPVGKKNAELTDSLKTADYQYSLPIWGDKATQKGFVLPYSAGVSVQYIWQEQDLIIENLEVGFNNAPMRNLDEIVRFDNSSSEAKGINIRPDFWLFPFLNIYGILAKSQPSTTVNFGIWIPDSTGTWSETVNLSTKAEFDAFTFGFGVTPTVGVGGGFLALDMNFTWTDVDALEKPAFSFIFDPRFGKSFKLGKPDRTLAVWLGGFRWNINSGTKGSLPISDLVETDGLGSKIEQGNARVENAQSEIDEWWGNLTPLEQNNPVNKAKFETANRALEAAGSFLSSAEGAVSNISSSTVQYSLDKRPAEKWNFIVGGQFQLNKRWMVRGEYGFLGTRNQFFAGLQYRFGI